MKKLLSALVLLTIGGTPLPLRAQTMWERLANEDTRIEPEDVGKLSVKIDNLNFFRDNEYSTVLTKGYSLPGLWLRPRLSYTPLSKVELELGLHALVFNGANKYPCYVYHDIATWKGNQYQRGAHVLPWIRAKAQFRHLTIVLGDIYGGQQHGLPLPLYNPENNLSQDPEMGFQLLWERRHLQTDTWMNWQSYIFEEDTHQEAFTVGANWTVKYYTNPERHWKWYTPVSLVIQHRGGEQDHSGMGVQTLCNLAAGARVRWEPAPAAMRRKAFNALEMEAHVMGTYQQNGHLWPFTSGLGLHGAAKVVLLDGLELKAGGFHAPRNFVSLYGSPFFSTLAQTDAQAYRGITTAYAQANYTYTFARHYSLGADVELYQNWLGKGQTRNRQSEMSFSFGIYFRVHPDILIKNFRKK